MNRKSFLQRIITAVTGFFALPFFSFGRKPKVRKGFIEGTNYHDPLGKSTISYESPWMEVVLSDKSNGFSHCLPPVYRGHGVFQSRPMPASDLKTEMADRFKDHLTNFFRKNPKV